MLSTIEWFVRLALEVTCVFVGLWVFGYICRHGTGAVKELIRTIGLTVKAVCEWIQEKLSSQKEKKPAKDEEEDEKVILELSGKEFKEFERMMRERKTTTL